MKKSEIGVEKTQVLITVAVPASVTLAVALQHQGVRQAGHSSRPCGRCCFPPAQSGLRPYRLILMSTQRAGLLVRRICLRACSCWCTQMAA
jgi:hypothetical protein